MNKKIKLYQEEIKEKNRDNFISFSLGACIVTGIIFLIGIVLKRYTAFTYEYFVFFIYLLFLYCMARFTNKHLSESVTFLFYLALCPIFLGAIAMGTFLDPNRQAVTFIVLLSCIPIFITDYPWRKTIYIIGLSLTFMICSYITKDIDMFMSDMMNGLIFTVIVIGVNYYMLKDSIVSVENYLLVKEKSQMDTMTSLLNRGTGESLIRNLIKKNTKGSFIILDIDDFKHINDTYGHQIGDEVIRAITEQIKKCFRSNDVLLRLGGDEFAIYAVDLVQYEVCQQKLDLLLKMIREIDVINNQNERISISIGCTILTKNQVEFEDVYHSSDQALYHTKELNKGHYIITEMKS